MLTIVFGTRPEYLKLKPLIYKLKLHKIAYSLFHISQHEHIDTGDIPVIYIRLMKQEAMTRLCILSTEIISKLDHMLDNTRVLLVQGDTATAYFSALVAFHKNLPVFHLEAGLRTYDLQNPFPEEGYRSMISRIATYHLCPDPGARQNLLKENITHNVWVIGNTILDLIKSYNLTPTIGSEVLITIHRRENWDTILDILAEIIRIVSKMTHLQFTWILHPNPELRSKILDYSETHFIGSNLTFTDQLNHLEMATRIANASFIITDSGGIQEEASFLGKHCYVVRKITERSSIPSRYITIIPDVRDLYPTIVNAKIDLQPPCTVYGDGDACDKFLEIYKTVQLS